jgi:transcriptional regulator with XRE-family HTH domain
MPIDFERSGKRMKKVTETVHKISRDDATPAPSPRKVSAIHEVEATPETIELLQDADEDTDLPVALDSQDPHALSGSRDNVLEVAIGREVRAFRKKLGITVSDLARATGLSLGMLSKIENGVTSASLTTLQRLSRALGVPVTALFRRFEEKRDAVFVRAGQGLVIERRGTRAGHQYQLLGFSGGNASGLVVEPYMITLTEKSDVFPLFQHSGLEFLYMLEGEVVYRHGDKLYTMLPGDSLFFDADAPHGPEELVKLPIRFLSIISYAREREE